MERFPSAEMAVMKNTASYFTLQSPFVNALDLGSWFFQGVFLKLLILWEMRFFKKGT
jgi:hypothetical protein